jgi:hypothetical protein
MPLTFEEAIISQNRSRQSKVVGIAFVTDPDQTKGKKPPKGVIFYKEKFENTVILNGECQDLFFPVTTRTCHTVITLLK